MKKRVVSLLLATVMTAMSVVGCGSSAAGDTAAEGASKEEAAAGEDNAAEESSASTEDGSSTESDASKVDMTGAEITFWHAMGGVNGEALEHLVNQFNEENEYGIKVISEYRGLMMIPSIS